VADEPACGVRKLDHAADLGIHREVGDPTMGIAATGECVLRLVQRMGFAAELEDATRPRCIDHGRADVEPLVRGAAEF
jgi:hypothetical protein